MRGRITIVGLGVAWISACGLLTGLDDFERRHSSGTSLGDLMFWPNDSSHLTVRSLLLVTILRCAYHTASVLD